MKKIRVFVIDSSVVMRSILRHVIEKEADLELAGLVGSGEEALKEKAIDQRSGKFSEKKYEREMLNRGKREHRVLMNLLKNVFEAVEEGIIPAEAILLPWIEDVEGNTVYDKLAPSLGALATMPLHKALTSGDEK